MRWNPDGLHVDHDGYRLLNRRRVDLRPLLLEDKREVGRFPDFARCRLQFQPQDRLAGGSVFGDSNRVVV
jgi:hypothetical protein